MFLTEIIVDHVENDGKKDLYETYTDQQIEDSIDKVVEWMDRDKDGFISYEEYVTASAMPPAPGSEGKK